MKRICVFCGSRTGHKPEYAAMATQLGHYLADNHLELIYGGGNIGLMGLVANACLAKGGKVTGVIPSSLVGLEVQGEQVEHLGLTRLEVVDSMHTRKARMAELADGFIALPGGIGTFEELFEIFTWAQLGYHRKPIGLLNVVGYFDPLLDLCRHAVNEGFLKEKENGWLISSTDPASLMQQFETFRPENRTVWIQQAEQL
jgi:uncharacterized protein (TIGR00730 family)